MIIVAGRSQRCTLEGTRHHQSRTRLRELDVFNSINTFSIEFPSALNGEELYEGAAAALPPPIQAARRNPSVKRTRNHVHHPTVTAPSDSDDEMLMVSDQQRVAASARARPRLRHRSVAPLWDENTRAVAERDGQV